MDIGDNELMEFIIVDIDNLQPGKREWLNKSCNEIANALDIKSCHVFDSSSRKPDKCKVYLELFAPISTDDMESYLTEFEIYCDIDVDKCTKSAYQLNYGIMLDDPKYKLNSSIFITDIPSTRSTKSKKEAFLPVNQQEKNRLLGKKPYTDPRLEWNYYRFTHRDGSWHRDIITIKVGMRQKTLPLLITTVTFNAVMYNKLYNKVYTHTDVYNKVCTIIALQFEYPRKYLNENRQSIYKQCYNEWSKQMSRDVYELYGELCSKLNKPEKTMYTPREQSGAAMYRSIQDKLNTMPYDDAIDLIGYMAEGDERLMKIMYRYYSKSVNLPRKNRSDVGKKRSYTKRKNTIELETIVSKLEKKDDIFLIPSSIISNALTQYLYRKKEKYQKI